MRKRLDEIQRTFDHEHAMHEVNPHADLAKPTLPPVTPPLARTPMAPRPWSLGLFARYRDSSWTAPDSPDPRGRWHYAGVRRRLLLPALIIAQTWIAAEAMRSVLPYRGGAALELAVLALFAVLFAWVSAGFWTALAGFLVLATGRDRYSISRSAPPDAPIAADARTALVMPIANESVPRVFAGLRATWESLARTPYADRFDLFVLSDTSDPDTRVAELAAWRALVAELGMQGRIFYRWRQHRIKKKAGNVADFCRRWGSRYRYMIVLDADSVMTGACMTRLVKLAEANPNSGIIQTAPRAAGRGTLYARMQQFATCMYGPLFTAGLHFWQLGEAHYWGHNALIRVEPFIRHCALARLPGRGALAGEILSHDFVEAALMRRAGWAVWIAYDLPGSFEEMPPNLTDELQRDRRWCQGNLMNFRLFFASGLHPAHRAVFMTGVMAYLSAPLWFAFLVLSTTMLAVQTLGEPMYFPQPYQLFPTWPQWNPQWALSLLGATAMLLLLPKFLSVMIVPRAQARRFGGAFRLTLSVLFEMLLSMLFAPIRMLFHTRFVLTALAGKTIRWKSPSREDAQTPWSDAITRHGPGTVLGLAWAALVLWLDPAFLPWLAPVVGALALSIPLAVLTSRIAPGRWARRARLFVIPEETDPPREIRDMQRYARTRARLPGLIDAVVDPTVNAIAIAARSTRSRETAAMHQARVVLTDRALEGGPLELSTVERSTLLNDPIALAQLHERVRATPNGHSKWGAATSAR
ncbi:MAG TPA: glucans biosynthesis glucosyltransferase MdoH [Casimicrobiaceae bacterium]|nr:glucans biosynthesis glucosyltransferase MdoH [Casimicrobiaceae bacterium]